jgi:hypothetical protein
VISDESITQNNPKTNRFLRVFLRSLCVESFLAKWTKDSTGAEQTLVEDKDDVVDRPQYSPDGQSFIIQVPGEGSREPLNLVTDWTTELKK